MLNNILAFLLLSIFSLEKKETPPPNILWIVLEDMSPQYFKPYGNEVASTPVIDSLINQGTRFDAAFSTGAVCSPSRYTIITGTRTNAYGTGHHRSAYPIPEDLKPFPYYLKEAGYHTSNNYKEDYNTSALKKLSKEAWTESSGKAGWWNRKEGQPFFAVFNFNNCHQSRTFTNPYDDYKKRILDKLEDSEIIDDADIIIPDFYKNTPALRKELARTYNALKKTDNEVDTLFNHLKKDNLLSSTIIFIYADHGGGSLRSKSFGSALGHQVPMAVIVPKAYKHLNPFKGKKSTDQTVTFEDLGPTVLGLAGIKAPDYMTGKPFMGQNPEKQEFAFSSVDRSGESMNLTRSVSDGRYYYTRVFYPNKPAYSWQKYFDYSASRQLIRAYQNMSELNKVQSEPFSIRGQEYLYDLKADTWQVNNLAENPKFSKIKNKLSTALDEKLLTIKDVHFLPEYMLDSLAKTTTAYDYKNTEAYDFDAIYNVAKLAGAGKEALNTQLKAIKSVDPIVRYWGVLGLSAQSNEVLKPNQKEIESLLDDNFAPTRIITASILFKTLNSSQAKQILQEYIHHKNPYLVVQTLQEIIYYPKEVALGFADDIDELSKNNKNGLVSESIDIFKYLCFDVPLYYQYHW
ncbi:sulfatase [Flammeovirga sp. MY04]|uniref:sulfatase family protein n=1 Tax=Flammeovirga sp. MY04 TaxID=1191459 RepID=UPI00080631B7|nr:sulfatase [Flammeovirga sp. MY04]ANQ51645.1 sulfatase [Flammeovirga sp. MY04]